MPPPPAPPADLPPDDLSKRPHHRTLDLRHGYQDIREVDTSMLSQNSLKLFSGPTDRVGGLEPPTVRT